MTTVADVETLLARTRRLRDRIRQMRGAVASWEFTFPDGITERYTIRDIMPIEQLEDDVRHLFLWAWSAKDYLKHLAKARGHSPKSIENLVDRTPALCLVADVANRLKHSELNHSRSGDWPKLDRPGYKIEKPGLQSIEVSREGVTLTPTSPEAVEVSFAVVDPSGKVLADAIVLLSSTFTYWEIELAKF